MTNLESEIATYNRLLPGLLGQQGKFVLIKGAEQFGIFETYQDALSAGYQKFQLDPFFVKQISPAERVAFFTRDLTAPA
jgi:hypothetical protein